MHNYDGPDLPLVTDGPAVYPGEVFSVYADRAHPGWRTDPRKAARARECFHCGVRYPASKESS